MGDVTELVRSVSVGGLGLANGLPSQWCAACFCWLFHPFSLRLFWQDSLEFLPLLLCLSPQWDSCVCLFNYFLCFMVCFLFGFFFCFCFSSPWPAWNCFFGSVLIFYLWINTQDTTTESPKLYALYRCLKGRKAKLWGPLVALEDVVAGVRNRYWYWNGMEWQL